MAHEKAASRNTDAPLALGIYGYARMPLVLSQPEMEDEDQRRSQRATVRPRFPLARESTMLTRVATLQFMRLIAEDGTLAAHEELEADTGDDA